MESFWNWTWTYVQAHSTHSLIVTILLAGGVIGGQTGFELNRFRTGDNGGHRLRWLLLGVAASFVLPLFFQLISSRLIEPAKFGFESAVLLFGFSLLSAIFAVPFLLSIGEQVFSFKDIKSQVVKLVDHEARILARYCEGLFWMSEARLGTPGAYATSIGRFQMILAEQPDHRDALLEIARAYKRRNEPGDVEKAIEFLDKAIAAHPTYSRVYYNRACYKCVAKLPVREWSSDLRKALELDPELRKYVLNDADFASVLDDADFKDILK